MMNTSVVNKNSESISTLSSGYTRVLQHTPDHIYPHGIANDAVAIDEDRDAEASSDINFTNYISDRTASDDATNLEANSSLIEMTNEEPRAKKRRKQSNPVRYGQSPHPAILPLELDGGEEVDEEELISKLRAADNDAGPQGIDSESEIDEDEEEEEMGDVGVNSLDVNRKKLLNNNGGSVINFHRSKYQYYCPHCSCPFSSDDDLRSHIEEEHVQKLLERQLFQQHQQQQQLSKSLSNGPSQLRPSSCDVNIKFERQKSRSNDSPSCDSSSSNGSNGSNNNTPLQSPLSQMERKSYETNLPHSSSDQTAKDFSNFLPFQLPNMPPLVPLSQSGSVNSVDGNKSSPTSTTSAGQMQLAMFSNPMAPFLFPVLPGQGGSGSSNGSGMPNGGPPVNASGVRIFNPEAYCELCNKEFCNKYFLKTHKANKHGIYSVDSMVTSSGYGGPFFPSGLTNTTATQAAAMQMQQLLQSANASMSASGSSPEGLVTASMVRAGIINMESYCEICQKEFCNKYFLKKHKQKIHGLVDPGATQSSSASPGSASNEPTKGNSPSPSPAAQTSMVSSTATIMSTTMTDNNKQVMKASDMSPNQLVCEHCKQEFANVVMLQTHRFTVHGPQTSMLACSPAQLQSLPNSGESPSGIYRPILPPSSLASSLSEAGNAVFTPEKLREMGVINADAFCEICCKEFCNKYFLRTHKMNKHGINVDTNSSTKSQSGQVQGDRQGEDSNNMSPKSNDDSYLEPGQRDPASYNNGTGPDFLSAISGQSGDLQCEVCNRPFSSNYLLKMHKFYSHNIPYIKEEDVRKSMASSPGLSNTDIPDNARNSLDSDTQRPHSGNDQTGQLEQSNNDQASQDLQKLQSMIKELNSSSYLDRATCNLCRQEFENKYFLRVHMMNDHGVIPTDDAALDSATLMRTLFDPSRITFPLQSGTSQSGASAPGSSGSGAQDSEAFCDICQKEFCSKYFLKTHRQNIHGIPFDGPPTPTSTTSPALSLAVCSVSQSPIPLQRKPSEGEISIQLASIKNKLAQMPQMPPQISSQLPTVPSQLSTPTTMATGKQVPSQMNSDGKPKNLTGRNYCNICNKELCNKYFMKTHMLKMHGINIDEHPAEAASSSTIGGVTCDICQKELCSKYFLKVHKQNTHGIYEDPPQPKEPRNVDPNSGNHLADPSHGIDPNDTNNRYFSHYTEVCPLCERRFKSIKWLKTHMINDHSDLVASRPTDLTTNNNHLNLVAVNPANDLARMCILCGQTFGDRVALHIHLVKDHRTTSDELGIGANFSGMKNTSGATDLSMSSVADQQQLAHHSLSLHTRINGSTSPHIASGLNLSGSLNNSNNSTPSNSGNNSRNNNTPNNANPNTCLGIANITLASTMTTSSLDNVNTSRPNNAMGTLTTPSTTSALSLSAFSAKRAGGSRIYHCSYCNYSTRWLSNLYAHEKRHTRMNTEADKRFVCRICHRAYRYNHSLQRHLLNHRAAGLNVRDATAFALFASTSNRSLHHAGFSHTPDKNALDGKYSRLPSDSHFNRSAMGPAKVKRYRCSKCNKKFRTREMCLRHIRAFHSESRKIILASTSSKLASNKLCRCVYCGFVTRNYNLLSIHINKNHKNEAVPADFAQMADKNPDSPLNLRRSPQPSNPNNVLSLPKTKNESKTDLHSDSGSDSESFDSQTLPPLNIPGCTPSQLSQSQIPMSYAMPRSPPPRGSFIMQPFLITQPISDGGVKSDTFAPSLVYLPVCHKVLQPVTVAFQLTPA